MSETETGRRTVRSFVRRTGRMTPGQSKALADLWPCFGLESTGDRLDLDVIFGRSNQKVLDIGFGNGEDLVHQAASEPDKDFIGIEVHEPGVGHCLLSAREHGITNLRVIIRDAIDALSEQIPDQSIASISLLFPDPWPKKRHHKRRIIQESFLDLVARKLVPGGALLIATDWANYAGHIDDVIAASGQFQVSERREHAGDRPLMRTTTKFEKRGLMKGHKIFDWKLTLK